MLLRLKSREIKEVYGADITDCNCRINNEEKHLGRYRREKDCQDFCCDIKKGSEYSYAKLDWLPCQKAPVPSPTSFVNNAKRVLSFFSSCSCVDYV